MKTLNITVYQATENMWLTENIENPDARTFTKSVINPAEGEWIEWTETQKLEWEADHMDIADDPDIAGIEEI